MDSYKTLAHAGKDEITIQKSRFIGEAWPCSSEEEALFRIKEIRESSRDARHHCFAYVIGKNEGIIRYSDDGEPGGTAGLPMLNLIRSEKLVNCSVVVTRYFGGILLGTGGLVRAYTQGCRIALKAAGIIRMEKTFRYFCEVPYAFWDPVKYALDHLPVKYQDVQFDTAVSFTLFSRAEHMEEVLQELNKASGRNLETLFEEEKDHAWEC